MNISNTTQTYPVPALWRLGFRPFFLGAGFLSATAMLAWFWVYQTSQEIPYTSPSYWHAHEMIFGYAAAVIVGFVLTAAKNWTGVQTLYGKALALLFLVWAAGRFFPLIPKSLLGVQAAVDSGFLFLAVFAIAYPVIKTKQWQHIGVVAKVLLMGVAHVIFYLGVLGFLPDGQRVGLYFGFYIVVALVLMMMRRLIPFFIERGVDAENVHLRNSKFLDRTSLALFVVYLVLEVFFPNPMVYAVALLLFVLHSVRLVFWYHNGIWNKPLLWSLYLAYVFLTAGFLLKAIGYVYIMPANLATHSFAFGVGMVTLSMMSRVSLGHTGRNVLSPPKALTGIFSLLVIGFVARVILPMFDMGLYTLWVGIAQLLWVVAFFWFFVIYAPMFLKPRIDGEFG